MTCKICVQLEEAVAAARRPDEPEMLLGLREAALRNYQRQKEERQLKTALDLEKHQRSCRERADSPSF
jgi:hypothetical protein